MSSSREMDIARKLAKSMISPNVMDYIPLSEDYMIFELAPPNSFLGKTLAELQLRNRFNIEVIAVRDVVADKGEHGAACRIRRERRRSSGRHRRRDISKIK